ncbi:MAG: hypothetical protein AVDCRST_MAG27-2490, partial [uncultured Craurococcus sp.]
GLRHRGRFERRPRGVRRAGARPAAVGALQHHGLRRQLPRDPGGRGLLRRARGRRAPRVLPAPGGHRPGHAAGGRGADHLRDDRREARQVEGLGASRRQQHGGDRQAQQRGGEPRRCPGPGGAAPSGRPRRHARDPPQGWLL